MLFDIRVCKRTSLTSSSTTGAHVASLARRDL